MKHNTPIRNNGMGGVLGKITMTASSHVVHIHIIIVLLLYDHCSTDKKEIIPINKSALIKPM
jgi:hypothetical protein